MKDERKLINDSTYSPKAGDIIWTDFDPRVGREQSGRRPALVLSPVEFFRASAFAIVCPITSKIKNFGSSVLLPTDFEIQGEILTSHVRSIDTIARPIKYAGVFVSKAILSEVRAKLAILSGIEVRLP
jgi:mRNA interferase MazF